MYGRSRSSIDPADGKLDVVPPKTGGTSLGSGQRSDQTCSTLMWQLWDRDEKGERYR